MLLKKVMTVALNTPLMGRLPAQNVEYLDALGSVLAEVGEQEEAITVLQKAVELQPERGYSKYMCASEIAGVLHHANILFAACLV